MENPGPDKLAGISIPQDGYPELLTVHNYSSAKEISTFCVETLPGVEEMLLNKQQEECVPHHYKTNDGTTQLCTRENLCSDCVRARNQLSEKLKANSELLRLSGEASMTRMENVRDVQTLLLAQQLNRYARHYYNGRDGNLRVCTPTDVCEVCAQEVRNRTRQEKELGNKDYAQEHDVYRYQNYPNIHIHNNIVPPANSNRNPSVDIRVNNSHPNIEIHNNILPQNYYRQKQNATTKGRLKSKLNKSSKGPCIDLNDRPVKTVQRTNISGTDPCSSKHASEGVMSNAGMQNVGNISTTPSNMLNNTFNKRYQAETDLCLDNRVTNVATTPLAYSGQNLNTTYSYPKDTRNMEQFAHYNLQDALSNTYNQTNSARKSMSTTRHDSSANELAQHHMHYNTSVDSSNQQFIYRTQVSNTKSHSTSTITNQVTYNNNAFRNSTIPPAFPLKKDTTISVFRRREEIATSIHRVTETSHASTLSAITNVASTNQDVNDGVNHKGGRKECHGKEKMLVKFPFKRKSVKERFRGNDATSYNTSQASSNKWSDSLIPNRPQDNSSLCEETAVQISTSSCTDASEHGEHTEYTGNNMWSIGNTNKLSKDKISLVSDTVLKEVGGSGWIIDADDDNVYILDCGKIRVISTKTFKKESINHSTDKVENSSEYLSQNITPAAKNDDSFSSSNRISNVAHTGSTEMSTKITPRSILPHEKSIYAKPKQNKQDNLITKRLKKNTKRCGSFKIECGKTPMALNAKSAISTFPSLEIITSMPATEPSSADKLDVGANLENQNTITPTESNLEDTYNNKVHTDDTEEGKYPVNTQTAQNNVLCEPHITGIGDKQHNSALVPCVSSSEVPNNFANKDGKQEKDKYIKRSKNNVNKNVRLTEGHKESASELVPTSAPVTVPVKNFTDTQKPKVVVQKFNDRDGTDRVKSPALVHCVSTSEVPNILANKDGKQRKRKHIKRSKNNVNENLRLTAGHKESAGKLSPVSAPMIAPINNLTDIRKPKVAAQKCDDRNGTDRVKRKYLTEEEFREAIEQNTQDNNIDENEMENDKSLTMTTPEVAQLADDVRTLKLSMLDLNPMVVLHCLLEDVRRSKTSSAEIEASEDSTAAVDDESGEYVINEKHGRVEDKKEEKDNTSSDEAKTTCEDYENGRASTSKRETSDERNLPMKGKNSTRVTEKKMSKKEVGEGTFIDLTTERRYSAAKRHIVRENNQYAHAKVRTVDNVDGNVKQIEQNDAYLTNMPEKRQVSLSELNMNLKVTLHDVCE